MGVIGINSVNAPQKKDTMDKIAQGLNIANSVLGVSLAVPEYLQKRDLANSELNFRNSELQNNQLKTSIDVASKTRPATPDEVTAGQAVDLGPKYGQVVPLKENDTIKPFAEKEYDNLLKTNDTAQPNEAGASQKQLMNGMKVWIKPKAPGTDPEQVKQEQQYRQDYLHLTDDYKDQAQAYDQIAVAKNNYAGGLSLLKNYMLLVNPAIKRQQGFDIEALGKAGSLPGRLQESYNHLVAGQGLPADEFMKFKQAAQDAFAPVQDHYNYDVKNFKDIAKRNNLNEANIVIPFQTMRHFDMSNVKPKTDLNGNPIE